MEKVRILWVDDEIELLQSQILFLQEKNYEVITSTNGDDALQVLDNENFDIVFLDENMPGLSGLETLLRIKDINSNIPVIMITKSEEESIMEDAIGSKISDYLIKPVNPNQILLSIKKNLENKELVTKKTNSAYQSEFRKIGMTLGENLDYNGWIDIYKKLVFWELELEKSDDHSMFEILNTQKEEANRLFGKYIESNYKSWLNSTSSSVPLLSHNLLKEKVFPLINENDDQTVVFILIDNLRYDQWKIIQPTIGELFNIKSEELYYSILPTATQYSRNAIFAGLMPSEISRRFRESWLNDDEEGGKNQYEEEFLLDQLERNGKRIKCSYLKIVNYSGGKMIADKITNFLNNKLNVIVYNFVDILSHARTEMDVIRELASDESAYRSITLSWFKHSPLYDILKTLSEEKVKLIISTDHGTIRVHEASKIIGDRNTSTNLRYKLGRKLQYDKRHVFEILNPEEGQLPKPNVTSSYVFAKEDKFFAYPNNYNYYVNYYKNTFQHGGVSLEEMVIPLAILDPK